MSEILTGEAMVTFVFVISGITVCAIIWQVIYFDRDSSKKKTDAKQANPDPNS